MIKRDARQDELGEGAMTGDAESSATVTETRSKRPFVEPSISMPVDVLEATTFFQLADSGATT